MTEPTTTARPKRRTWLRVLLWAAGAVVCLVIVLYFVATSGAFFKGVILPKVSKSLGADVTVADASISPFSQVVLRDFKVQAPGREPIVTASEVRARYNLRAILGGNIKVDEVALVAPVVQMINNADGTSNLDPFLKKPAPAAAPAPTPPAPSPAPPPAQPAPAPPSKPLQVDIQKVLLENATVRMITKTKEGGRDSKELTNVRLTLENLKNGQTGKLTLASDIALETVPPPGTNASLQARLAGEFALALTPDLKPGSVKGSLQFTVNKAAGALADASTLAAHLDCDLTPTDLKQLALRFQKAGTDLAVVRVSGPFDTSKLEGKLKLEAQGIDRNVLNLAGAASGIDFGTTLISSQSDIDIAKTGQSLGIVGQVTVAKLSLTRAGVTTPPVDLALSYGLSVDQAGQAALVKALKLGGTQNQRPILDVSLSSPMAVSWGKTSEAVGDAALLAVVTNFNLADWKAMIGDMTGTLNASLKLDSRKAGKELGFNLDTQLQDFAGVFASNRVSEVGVHFATRGSVTNLQLVSLSDLLLEVRKRTDLALKLTGSGQFDQATTNADLQLGLDGNLPSLLALAARPDLVASSGAVSAKTRVGLRQQTQTISGSAALKSFSGTCGGKKLQNLEGGLDFDLVQQQQKLDLRQVRLALAPTARASNDVRLAGQVDMTQSNAITGALKLQADSLDLTPYYDMFAAKPTSAPRSPGPGQPPPTTAPQQPPAPTGTPPPPTSGGEQEPPPVNLPLKNFTVEAGVGRCYLREIEITNLQTTLKLDGSQVTIRPAQLALNGKPVKADVDLNLGTPGYQYAIGFTMDSVPLEPLANSFAPEYRGQAKGDLIANVQIKGAGSTGANLQKSLSGRAGFAFTNANIQLNALNGLMSIGPVRFVLNPIAGGVRAITAQLAKMGVSELVRVPLDLVDADVAMGNGKISVTTCEMVSKEYQASTGGDILIANVLNDSHYQNWPVNFSLRRSHAETLHLVSRDAPTNTPYVALPTLVKVTGTLGTPEYKTDFKALGGALLKSVTEIPGIQGTKAGDALKGLSNLLPGSKSTNTVTGTNAPATNAPVNKLLDLLRKPKK